MSTQEITIADWPPPKGFANGRSGKGRALHVAGQIATLPDGTLVNGKFAEQFAQALDNVIAVVRAGGGVVEDIAEMTVFVTTIDAYRQSRRELGGVWRERMGTHYPAMAVVAVADLFERDAFVEIQAVAYVGDA